MSTYQCEGFVKEVKIASNGKVSFTIEPTAPYLFEKKEDDGKTKKLLLMVDDSKKPIEARSLCGDEEPKFSAPSKCDLSTMLVAKANHLKVRATSGLGAISKCPISVKALTVL